MLINVTLRSVRVPVVVVRNYFLLYILIVFVELFMQQTKRMRNILFSSLAAHPPGCIFYTIYKIYNTKKYSNIKFNDISPSGLRLRVVAIRKKRSIILRTRLKFWLCFLVSFHRHCVKLVTSSFNSKKETFSNYWQIIAPK